MKTACIALACVASAQAFVAPSAFSGVQLAAPAVSVKAPTQMNVFTDAQASFGKEFPEFYEAGWGPTAKAERWNGRHAMFGWVAIIATGYAKAHGLIPDAEMALSVKEWGTLAILQGSETITNERAIILIAHVHALMVSICAAMAPLSFQDKLLLGPGEKDEEPAGLIPAFVPGITKEAELMNGRMAMMGLITVTATSIATGTPFLDVVNKWLGGL
ncbi:unnamed protein product [Chrysoparadoxa australica]